jgi:hypothetical protein
VKIDAQTVPGDVDGPDEYQDYEVDYVAKQDADYIKRFTSGIYSRHTGTDVRNGAFRNPILFGFACPECRLAQARVTSKFTAC